MLDRVEAFSVVILVLSGACAAALAWLYWSLPAW